MVAIFSPKLGHNNNAGVRQMGYTVGFATSGAPDGRRERALENKCGFGYEAFTLK
jgi:hypothetical protein